MVSTILTFIYTTIYLACFLVSIYHSSHNIEVSLFLFVFFSIYKYLNEFSDKIEKHFYGWVPRNRFAGAGDSVTCPYKSISNLM